jgi:hypothetical protein
MRSRFTGVMRTMRASSGSVSGFGSAVAALLTVLAMVSASLDGLREACGNMMQTSPPLSL